MGTDSVERFIRLLKKSPVGAVFNPWWQIDEENDFGPDAPVIRRKQLRAYLQERLATATLAIVGEALGYRGGHFTGIPMTSERLLLGKKPEIVAALPECPYLQRTSKPNICADGFSEPTATIVWGALLRLGLKPKQFVLWNEFPWHSFDPARGLLSNRMPNVAERVAGVPVLKAFLDLFRCEQVVALGKIAAAQLAELGVNACCIRHPASGGAKLFRQQIAELTMNRRRSRGR